MLYAGCSPSATIDCEKDLSCFVSASKTCSEAKVNYVIKTDMFGVMQETDINYELKTTNEGKCSLSLIVNDINIRYTDSLIDMMKQGGVIQDQINQQLEKTESQYDIFVEKEGVCKGDKTEISAILKRWQEGAFSTSDLNNLECSGPYFDLRTGSVNEDGSISISFGTGEDSETECRYSRDCEEGFVCSNQKCIIGETKGYTCSSNKDCSGNEICVNGICYLSVQEFEDNWISTNDPCCLEDDTWCHDEYGKKNKQVIYCSNLDCQNCKSGFTKCRYSAGEVQKQRYLVTKCVECSASFDCKEGYKCEEEICINE